MIHTCRRAHRSDTQTCKIKLSDKRVNKIQEKPEKGHRRLTPGLYIYAHATCAHTCTLTHRKLKSRSRVDDMVQQVEAASPQPGDL